MTNQELETALESLVDATSLNRVTMVLAEICFGKAEHLRSSWQDKQTAKVWDGAARFFARSNQFVEML